MNQQDEQRIAELAMKHAARQITPGEQAEQAELFAREPAVRREFERRRAEAQALSEAASLLNATESQSGELPGYARERLRAKVRETYGSAPAASKPVGQSSWHSWRLKLGWALGIAAMVAVVVLLTLQPREPVLHLAMLDPAGTVRGSENSALAALQSGWPETPANVFKTADQLAAWKNQATAATTKDTIFVIYDRSAGELWVSGKKRGRAFEKRFEVGGDLAPVLELARRFIGEQ